eukprot:2691594-Pyramimonas_sp.AAC.1
MSRLTVPDCHLDIRVHLTVAITRSMQRLQGPQGLAGPETAARRWTFRSLALSRCPRRSRR